MIEILFINMLQHGLYILLCICIVFIIAQWRKDNSIMDIAYGPIFFISAVAFLLDTGSTATTAYLIAGLMGLWSTRLGVRIFKKNYRKPEDARYATWRNEWSKRGHWYFTLRSFLQINLLQGVIIWIISLPFLIATSTSTEPPLLFVLFGLAVYGVGLAYETIADWQLDQYLIRKKAGTETAPLMTSGLFRYSRRPNYFGETLIWWGLTIMVLALPFGWLAIISPLLITYIVTQITGPMLERIFLEKYPAEYREYMRTTNYFIPGVPKN